MCSKNSDKTSSFATEEARRLEPIGDGGGARKSNVFFSLSWLLSCCCKEILGEFVGILFFWD